MKLLSFLLPVGHFTVNASDKGYNLGYNVEFGIFKIVTSAAIIRGQRLIEGGV